MDGCLMWGLSGVIGFTYQDLGEMVIGDIEDLFTMVLGDHKLQRGARWLVEGVQRCGAEDVSSAAP